MHTIGVRPAHPDDYDTIAAVIDDWWGREVGAALPRLFLAHFHASSLVAEDGEGLAGFLIGFVSPSDPETAYVHFAGVRPDLRRAGLARDLYARFLDSARRHGCRTAYAITAPDNAASIAFHRGLGFAVSDPIPDYNGPGRPMVTFGLALDQHTVRR